MNGRRCKMIAAAAASLWCGAAAAAADAPAADLGAAGRLAADVGWLAADSMEGRETGARGYRRAAERLAAEFQAIGLEPGADGGWFQEMKLRLDRRRLGEARFELILEDGGRRRLAHLEDYVIGRALAAPRFDVEAPLVFAGHGVVDPESGHDDYGSIDAEGRIVVVFDGAPRRFASEKRAFLAASEQKRRAAEARGAVGLISMPTEEGAERTPWVRTVEGARRPGAAWIGEDAAAHVIAPRVAAGAALSEAGAAILFEGAPHSYAELRAIEAADRAALPRFGLDRRARLAGASRYALISSPNVIARIKGRDPRLKGEVVVLSAHLDHIGIDRTGPRGADRINNGALDNAMGVAMLLEAARRFKAAPPRRTVVFLATAGEEMGLLGADYFARRPGAAKGRIVANLNLDMPLMLYPFADVVAFGAERSSLGDAAKRAADEAGLRLAPDPFPDEGVFTRSDHFRFVEQGVPAIYLFAGMANGGDAVFRTFMKERYHRPGDDLAQPIDYEAAARFAALNFRIAEIVADAEAAPSWRKGDYFGGMFARP